jgi:hypothetical protein
MDGAPFCPSVIVNKYYQRHKMNKPELSIARLEASLDAKISRHFDTLDTDPDVLKQLQDLRKNAICSVPSSQTN